MQYKIASSTPGIGLDGPRYVVMTAQDREEGAYGHVSLQKALEGLYQDGLVVLRGVVDVEHVEALNKFMCGEADEILKAKSKDNISAWNQGVPCKGLPYQSSVSPVLTNLS